MRNEATKQGLKEASGTLYWAVFVFIPGGGNEQVIVTNISKQWNQT